MPRIGSGFKGSEKIMTTTSTNAEIIPPSPAGWTVPYSFYKFSFINYSPCTVVFNKDPNQTIWLDDGVGFETTEIDAPIQSFVIKEQGVQYRWAGAY